MPCIPLPGGGIACTGRRRRPKCRCCGGPADRACDWKLGKGETCDAPICSGCSVKPAPEKDLCPAHAEAWEAWKAARAAAG